MTGAVREARDIRRSTRWPLLAWVPAGILLARRRRELGLPPAMAAATAYSVPLAFAAALPRGLARTAAAWSAHMWAYEVAYELPFDRPERAYARVHVDAPLAADTAIGGGAPPTQRLQRRLRRPPELTWLDWVATGVYALWEAEPHAALAWIRHRHPEQFAAAALRLAATYDATLVGYAATPTAPPWFASEREGRAGGSIRRVTAEVGKRVRGRPRPGSDHLSGANPWAAMPSDHCASAVSIALGLARADRRAGALGGAYAGLLALALVYTGEHYVVDVLAGVALALAVDAAAGPVVGPAAALARRVAAPSRGRQRVLGR